VVLARHRPTFEVAERKVLRDGSEVVRLREETYRHYCEKRSNNQLLVGGTAGWLHGWLHALCDGGDHQLLVGGCLSEWLAGGVAGGGAGWGLCE
jgi:hypothetical protein